MNDIKTGKKAKRIISLLFVPALIFGLTGLAHADIISVCKEGPPKCQYTSIKEALNASADGDIIEVDQGVYSEPRLTVYGGRTLRSTQPTNPGATTIRNTDNRAVIEAATATIEGFTITGGKGYHGGGVNLIGGKVLLKHLIIKENYAEREGGGVGTQTGSTEITIDNCDILNNSAGFWGGGVKGGHEKTTITNSRIKDNTALSGSGGGVKIPKYSTAYIANTIISGNDAYHYSFATGGGIYSEGSLTLSGGAVQGNTAHPGTNTSKGGGLYIITGNAVVNGTTITGNRAGRGGGIYTGTSVSGRRDISASISANIATEPLGSGGGLYCGGGIESLGGNITGNTPDQVVGCGTNIDPPLGVTRTSKDSKQGGDSNDPVSTFTGELFNQYDPDISLGGPMPLYFARYYSSGFTQVGIFARLGDDWRHNFDWKLSIIGANMHIIDNQGRTIQFAKNSSNWDLVGKKDIVYQLVETAGAYTLLDPRNQRMYKFNATGQLTGIEDGRGNSHTLSYAGGPLTQVSDGLGRVLNFTYDTNVHLVSVDDGLGRSVDFAYTGTFLTGVTDALGNTTTYAYTSVDKMKSRTLPEGNTPYVHNYWGSGWPAAGHVYSETDSNGNKTIFRYVGADTTITDPLGNTRVHTHTANGEFSDRQDQAGLSFSMGSDATRLSENVRYQL